MSSGLRNRRIDRLSVTSLIANKLQNDNYNGKKYSPSKEKAKYISNRYELRRILSILLFLIFMKKSSMILTSTKNSEDHPYAKPYAIELRDNDILRVDLSLVKVNGKKDLEYRKQEKRSVDSFEMGRITSKDSDDSEESIDDDDQESECQPLADWQEFVFPTCNKLHEYDISGNGSYINSGYNRDVWGIKDLGDDIIALKTLAVMHPFSDFMIDLQRTDALICERTTASKYVANIYAYCGASAVNDFASEGSLDDVYNMLPKKDRLRVATEVAHGLRDFHALQDEKGRTAVIHTDIAVRQFLKINGVFQLNDFNTAKLLYKNSLTGEICPRYMGKAKDKNRSPEEMLQELNKVTEMIDVYSMGNIFYKLITNERKYDDLPTVVAQKNILRNQLPPIIPYLADSDASLHDVLRNAIVMTLQRYPKNRKSAEEVYSYLAKELSKYEVGNKADV